MRPNDFLAFVQMSSMWSLQDILELMDTPRYLTPETQFNGKPLIMYFVLCYVYWKYALWNICVDLTSSVRHLPIIQVDQGPPAIEWHHLENGLYGKQNTLFSNRDVKLYNN